MIQPDRLKELIEQKATIYDKYGYKIDLAEEDNFLENIFNIYFKVEQGRLYRMNKDLQIAYDQWYLQNLFETKEDAEWYLEFENITREEKLSLPSWEDLEDFGCIRINSNTYLNWNKVINWISVCACGTECYFETATKENYIDVCRLCKKLFLGEKE